jgi:hypothetical protein
MKIHEEKVKKSEKIIKYVGKNTDYEYLNIDKTLLEKLSEFFEFKGEGLNNLIVKSENDQPRKIYYVTDSVYKILQLNNQQKKWNIVNLGKFFI